MKMTKWVRAMALAGPLVLAGCSDFGNGFSSYYGQDEELNSPHAIGVYHFAAGQFGLAVQYFQRATERDPQAIESFNGLAAAYDRLGRFDLAERQYRRALGLDPQSAQTLNNLGYSYWLQGRYDLALAYLREAEELEGTSSVIVANLKSVVAAYEKEGALAEATEPKAAEAVQQAEAPVQVRETWIERTGPNTQTLVTRPAMNLLSVAQRSDLPPELLSYRGAAEEPPVSFLFGADDFGPSVLQKTGQPAIPAQGTEVTHPTPAQSAEASEPLITASLGDEDLGLSGFAKFDQPIAVTQAEANQAQPANPDPTPAASAQAASLEGLRFDGQPLGSLEPGTDIDPAIQVTALSEGVTAQSGLQYTRRGGSAMELFAGLARETALSPVAVDTVVSDAVAPKIELTNALGVEGMAARLRDYFQDRGLQVDSLSNAENFGRAKTMIYYREEWRVYAMGLASILPAAVVMEPRDDVSSDIRIELGGDLINFDRGLSASRAPARDDNSG